MSEKSTGLDVTFQDVTKIYGQITAVDGVSLHIRAGEFLTLLGPSGSGKTTLLTMLAGFIVPSNGDVLVGGLSIVSTLPEKRNFGMVFQGYALFPHMTVMQNIAYPLEIRHRSRVQIKARVAEMLDLVQLQSFANRYPHQLSGGQQQRVALARALSFSPKILLLDEPLGALDRKLRADVQEQLKDIHKRVGTTFIYVTHDQEEALTMSDRIVIMKQGRIIQIGNPVELYEKPKTAFAASFLGKSNFIKKNNRYYALRPEKIDVFAVGEGKGANRLTGKIRSKTYMGASLKMLVDAPGYPTIEVHVSSWRNMEQYSNSQEVDLCWSNEAQVEIEDFGGEEAVIISA